MGSIGNAVLSRDEGRALSKKINELPYDPTGHGDTPNIFPYTPLKAVMTGDSAKIDPYAPENQKDGFVRIAGLKSTQNYLDTRNLAILSGELRNMTLNDLYDKRYPNQTSVVVLKKGKEYYVYDGNHRAALAKLLGKKTIRAKIVEV